MTLINLLIFQHRALYARSFLKYFVNLILGKTKFWSTWKYGKLLKTSGKCLRTCWFKIDFFCICSWSEDQGRDHVIWIWSVSGFCSLPCPVLSVTNIDSISAPPLPLLLLLLLLLLPADKILSSGNAQTWFTQCTKQTLLCFILWQKWYFHLKKILHMKFGEKNSVNS